jgi:hypothetical protein
MRARLRIPPHRFQNWILGETEYANGIRVVALAAAFSMIQGFSAPAASFSRDPFH